MRLDYKLAILKSGRYQFEVAHASGLSEGRLSRFIRGREHLRPEEELGYEQSWGWEQAWKTLKRCMPGRGGTMVYRFERSADGFPYLARVVHQKRLGAEAPSLSLTPAPGATPEEEHVVNSEPTISSPSCPCPR